MAEILSQSERESLLTAYGRGEGVGASPARRTRGSGEESSAPIRRELIRSIRTLHEACAGEIAAGLGALLRLPVDVRVISVDQATYGEFASVLESPACLNLIQPEPRDAGWMLELDCSIAFPVVDRLLGGDGAKSLSTPRRPFTEIEWRLLARATDRMVAALQSAWSNVGVANLKVRRVGSDAQALPFVAREAGVVLVGFDVLMGDAAGALNLCLPIRGLTPLEDRLHAAAHALDPRTGGAPKPASDVHAGIELIVQLAATRLTVDELTNLAVGDVIVTNCDQGQPLTVSVDGDSRFAGFAGLVKGRKAVRIDSALVPASNPHRQPLPAITDSLQPASAKSESVEGD